ncbi:Lipase, GDSL [Corchorus capsularis]|uniref:Lipase, GDSL n=1 Tax=Corchorus capsularis TaxID=210143 RepID=A0A1R3ILN3_COCAP|nr:Lipase, GDSL [Corchorus capsularis]
MAKNLLLIFLLISLLALSLELAKAQLAPAAFVLGDSLVDVGNNNYLRNIAKANFPHNGIDFAARRPTGRFCNGKNPADFIADQLGLPSSPPYLSLPKNASYINGVSFASGASGILNGTFLAYGELIPFQKQVGYFVEVHKSLVQQMGSSAAEKHLSKSLFCVIIGSNDFFDYFGSSELQKQHTPQQFIDLLATSLKPQLKKLYEFGARKLMVAGVGPLGCVPAERVNNKTHQCNEEHNSWSVKYNDMLKAMLKGLKSELHGLNYSYFDTYKVLHNIIQYPSAYGFNEIKAACCGLGELRAKSLCLPIARYCSNRKDHVFWDLYHPTEAAYRIIVDVLFDGSSPYVVPINVRQLVSS